MFVGEGIVFKYILKAKTCNFIHSFKTKKQVKEFIVKQNKKKGFWTLYVKGIGWD